MKTITRMDKKTFLKAEKDLEIITERIEEQCGTRTLNEILDEFYGLSQKKERKITCEEQFAETL